MSLKNIFAAVGVVALIDYMPDRQFDATGYVLSESGDAVTSLWNWGDRQIDRLTR